MEASQWQWLWSCDPPGDRRRARPLEPRQHWKAASARSAVRRIRPRPACITRSASS